MKLAPGLGPGAKLAPGPAVKLAPGPGPAPGPGMKLAPSPAPPSATARPPLALMHNCPYIQPYILVGAKFSMYIQLCHMQRHICTQTSPLIFKVSM